MTPSLLLSSVLLVPSADDVGFTRVPPAPVQYVGVQLAKPPQARGCMPLGGKLPSFRTTQPEVSSTNGQALRDSMVRERELGEANTRGKLLDLTSPELDYVKQIYRRAVGLSPRE